MRNTSSDADRPPAAAGADLLRVFALSLEDRFDRLEWDWDGSGPVKTSPCQLNQDLQYLEQELARMKANGVDVRLVVIDPIDRYFDSTD